MRGCSWVHLLRCPHVVGASASDMWTNFCRHCDRLISEDWTKYMGDLPFKNIPPFIISLGESNESDSESDSEMLSESEEVSNSSSEMVEAE